MTDASTPRAATGIAGLDDILCGGFVPNRLYLLEGTPGSGKTTLAFQFLMEGARLGETVLYVTLSETEEEIRAVAASHGWDFDGIAIRELLPSENSLVPEEQYTVFHPSEVELSETTSKVLDDVNRLKPMRIVFDSLSELRLLAGSPLRYRRQILALKQFFAGRRCTVLMLDDLTSAQHDLQVQSISHGALLLEHRRRSFGPPRRQVSVTKYRGSDFRGGSHDYCIRRGGLEVYPRLVPAEHRQHATREQIGSGLPALDALLGGGLTRGTSTLLQGAAGTGKSTVATLFAVRAAEEGLHAALFIFDEGVSTLFGRTDGLGIPLRKYVDEGRIKITQVDPAELSPGEFAHRIRQAVEVDQAAVVVVDGLNGYLNSMPNEDFLIIQLHDLLMYMNHKGVATILVSAQHGLIGSAESPIDASYLADTVMLIRYFETAGEVKQALSVVKMRSGNHERTIREFSMAGGRVTVGEPLRGYRGVLSGMPETIPSQ